MVVAVFRPIADRAYNTVVQLFSIHFLYIALNDMGCQQLGNGIDATSVPVAGAAAPTGGCKVGHANATISQLFVAFRKVVGETAYGNTIAGNGSIQHRSIFLIATDVDGFKLVSVVQAVQSIAQQDVRTSTHALRMYHGNGTVDVSAAGVVVHIAQLIFRCLLKSDCFLQIVAAASMQQREERFLVLCHRAIRNDEAKHVLTSISDVVEFDIKER